MGYKEMRDKVYSKVSHYFHVDKEELENTSKHFLDTGWVDCTSDPEEITCSDGSFACTLDDDDDGKGNSICTTGGGNSICTTGNYSISTGGYSTSNTYSTYSVSYMHPIKKNPCEEGTPTEKRIIKIERIKKQIEDDSK